MKDNIKEQGENKPATEKEKYRNYMEGVVPGSPRWVAIDLITRLYSAGIAMEGYKDALIATPQFSLRRKIRNERIEIEHGLRLEEMGYSSALHDIQNLKSQGLQCEEYGIEFQQLEWFRDALFDENNRRFNQLDRVTWRQKQIEVIDFMRLPLFGAIHETYQPFPPVRLAKPAKK